MTGPLAWLNQAPLENRKANKLIFMSAPIAIRSIQMAERDLLREAFSADVATRKRAVAAQFSALLSAATQQIIAHVQGKIAAVDPSLSLAARSAAIEQLMAEQNAAIAQLRQDNKLQRRQANRTASMSLRGKFGIRKRTLVQRHAIERGDIQDYFGLARRSRRPHRAFEATRSLIPLLQLRSRLRRKPLQHLR